MPSIALVGHNHTCPARTHKTPHVGGPITSGSVTMTVNGIPIALVGDTCACNVGGPDTITSGSATVTVNGIPVALVGSTTAHGGVIVEGDSALQID